MNKVKFYLLVLMIMVFGLAIWVFFHREPVEVSYYFDKAPYISPRIVDDLCNRVVAIDLDGSIGTNRYWGEIKVEESRVSIEPVDWYPLPHIWYQYIGKTDDGIYALKRGRDQDRSILLVEFQINGRNSGGIPNDLICDTKPRFILKKLCEIPLEENWDGKAHLEGRALSLGNLGILRIESPHSRQIRLFFHRFKAPNTALSCFLNRAPYINPKVIEDLISFLSDGGDQVLSIDLTGAEAAKNKWENECDREYFFYDYIGQSDDIHVLKTTACGGGSGVFIDILMITFERDYGMSVDWGRRKILQNKERFLIKKHVEFGLGDRWMGDLKLEGNQLYIGPDEGILAPLSKEGELLYKVGRQVVLNKNS